MNREDIIGNIIFFSVVILSILLSLHMVNNDIEIDTTPLYWPETFEPYPEPPEDYYRDIEMDCGEKVYSTHIMRWYFFISTNNNLVSTKWSICMALV